MRKSNEFNAHVYVQVIGYANEKEKQDVLK